MAEGLLSTYNYIVPAAGTTHGYQVSQVFSATPVAIDFRQVGISGQQFIPSGVFIDNTQGTGPLTITFLETAYRIVCAAGQAFQTQYPATAAQTAAIQGLGLASVIFVDFPVIPFVNAGGTASQVVTISNGGDVAQGSTTDAPQVVLADGTAATQTALLKGVFNQLLRDGNGQMVQGNVQSGAADVGAPVKTGGVYRVVQPTLADGQRGDLQVDTRANLEVTLMAPNSANSIANLLGVFTQGNTPSGSAVAGFPIRMGQRVRSTGLASLANDNLFDLVSTTSGATVGKPYSIPELDWSYGASAGGINNTTAVALKAAAGAGLRNYLTGISITNASATVPTEVVVLDGATPIWRGYVGSNLLLNSAVGVQFPTPLKSTANAALNVQCVTTGAAVYVNAQGYVAP